MSESCRVGLLVTCLVDLYRPEVGFAAIELLEAAGCTVEIPRTQTCCGQPGHNAGDRDDAMTAARRTIELFEGYDYVVAPSGSCSGMVRRHYAPLFADEPDWRARAEQLAARTYELTSFLTDVRGYRAVGARCQTTATFHDSCSSLREMQVHDQPRELLRSVQGLELRELGDSRECCGFGGTFCVKYPELSTAMADRKIDKIHETGAELLLSADLGCLLNLAGRLKRRGSAVVVRHVAEVLAEHLEAPGIGDPEESA